MSALSDGESALGSAAASFGLAPESAPESPALASGSAASALSASYRSL